MEIVENSALRIRVRNPDRFTAIIPKSHYEGEVAPGIHEILVHWGYDESIVLKNMGVKLVPSPISKNYTWPGMYTPMAHQRGTAEFLTMHKRAFCFDEMGLGKTAAAAWAADYLMAIGQVRRVLIICPVSIMQAAWQQDLFKVLMHRTVGIAHGVKDKRVAVINSDVEFVIINYDGVQIVEDEIKAGGFDLIIMDEANNVKNAQAQRSKSIKGLIDADTRVWLMTGTPAAQSPEDAYGLAKLVSPERVPKFFGSWRDMVMQKINMYKWVPRARAKDIVHAALQPAIRHTKEECLDLPEMVFVNRMVPLTKQQEKYYKILKEQMLALAAGQEITAVNAAAMLNKLLQLSCITYDTMTLTDSGWKPLGEVTAVDRVWDGVEWVQHGGVVFNGERETVWLDGVRMTPDHRVLTDFGWYPARAIIEEVKYDESSERFARATVRLPDGYIPCGDYCRDINPSSPMAMPLHLRESSNPKKPILTLQVQGQPSQLRVPPRKRDPSHDVHSTVQNMVWYAAQMLRPTRQRLQKLWIAGHCSMFYLGAFIRSFLDRHAERVLGTTDFGAEGQQRRVQQRKLPVGNYTAAGEQYSYKCAYTNTTGRNDGDTSSGIVRAKENNPACTTVSIQVAGVTRLNGACGGVQKVYDLLNAGPRSRFTVCGVDNKPIIVHNCGAVYHDNGGVVEFDVKPRLDALADVIDESTNKVIVFAPFRHTIALLERDLAARGYTTASIHGDVSSGKRGEIFSAFQYQTDPKVIIIQPQAAAHGVTLTEASTVVWFGPTTSLDTYLQANARAHRKGQKNKVTIVHLQGSAAEAKLYAALSVRGAAHIELLKLYKEIMEI